MTKRLAVVSMLIALAGCGSPGPVYRGAPPPGMTHKQYVQMLKGEVDPVRPPPDNSPVLGQSSSAAGPGPGSGSGS